MQLKWHEKLLILGHFALKVAVFIFVLRFAIKEFEPQDAGELLLLVLIFGLIGLALSFVASFIAAYIIVKRVDPVPALYSALASLGLGEVAPILHSVMPLIRIGFIIVVFYLAFKATMLYRGNKDDILGFLDPVRRVFWKNKRQPAPTRPVQQRPVQAATSRAAPPTRQGANPVLVKKPAKPKPRPRNLKAFDHLIGVDSAIQFLKDTLELPLLYPDKVKKYNLSPAKGLLLYGPPGTGKTSIAMATARYLGCIFYPVKSPQLVGSYVGTSEAQIARLFAEARRNAPSIIFFDEIDSIARKRDGRHLNRPSDIALTVLLSEMDGIHSNRGVFVIGATNRLDVLDEAILRPGRFDKHIKIDLPNREARIKLFQLYLSHRPMANVVPWEQLADLTAGASPADIRAICEAAATKALKRDVAQGKAGITTWDIMSAVKEQKK